MSDYSMKTYRDSYLYNKTDSKGQNMMKKHDTALLNFIMKAQRLDKNAEDFSGIREDIKRQQTSSVLYQIMMMENVYLCINNVELPPAFKVFEAYDVKSQERKPAIFIDVTKLITMKGGYYDCRDIGKLISYLMGALTYLVYRYDVAKMMNNSSLTLNGTECYVSMFDYVLDYLRIIGYSQNKERISYMVGLFYQVHMLGKDLDGYAKNIAAKIAKIAQTSVQPMDLFIEDGIFDSIDTFVSFLADTFKLRGLTTEVFINKWIMLYGNGSQYATELFTSFSVLLSYAFCGAYVINQKQVERCCPVAMVKYCNALLKAGIDTFDRSMYMEASELEGASRESFELSQNLKLRTMNPAKLKVTLEDYSDGNTIHQKWEANVDFYTRSLQPERLGRVVENFFSSALRALDESIYTEATFDESIFGTLLKDTKKYRDNVTNTKLLSEMDNTRDKYVARVIETNELDEDTAKAYANGIKLLMNARTEI